eukprot:5300534-Pyramimonas_sp.AAC.1
MKRRALGPGTSFCKRAISSSGPAVELWQHHLQATGESETYVSEMWPLVTLRFVLMIFDILLPDYGPIP